MWLALSDSRDSGWPSTCKVIGDRSWLKLRFDPAARQALIQGRPALDLSTVTNARLSTQHVMRWSSDDIVEDFSAELELLAGEALVVGLRANPHNRDTLATARDGFEKLAADWGWQLTKEHKEVDKT